MGKRRETRAALAATAAVAGTGYASGRELVTFFTQLGWASWPGILLAAALFGLLAGLSARLAVRMGADGFPALCRRGLGPGTRRAVGVVHGLLLALVAAAMLMDAGRVGELTLPVERGFLWGIALELALAALLNGARQRPLPWLGLVLLTAGVGFYGALALDPRPPQIYLKGEVVLRLAGDLPAAAVLALLYAALNACMAADVVVRFSGGCRPGRLWLLCGAMLGALLLCGNAALSRGGDLLLTQAMPVVLLSARWGLVGFWLCAGFRFLCGAGTLAAALRGLWGWLRGC